MRLVMYPGFMSASDPHEFKKTLGVLLVYRDRNYRPRPDDVIIGWGNSKCPDWADRAEQYNCPIINHWDAIKKAVDKSKTLKVLMAAGVRTISWTIDPHLARAWLAHGNTVFARTELRGNKGAGIVVMTQPNEFVEAPLYSQYESNCDEYRVHVAFGKVINFQKKLRKNGVEVDPHVRSEENGWVFARKNVNLPDRVAQEAIKAVDTLGLHFAGVDCLCNRTTGLPFILEVNTAPGLDYAYGIEAYTNAIKQHLAKEYHV